jgi:exonuclease III
MCIVETQVHKSRVERLASALGYDNCFAVSSEGRSGGLGIFWNNESKVEVFRFSRYHIDHIDARVLGIGREPWRITCAYGEAQTSERFKTWDTMKGIKSENDLPWLCLGDFNEVLRQEEHVGIGQRTQAQMDGFRDAIDVCGLRDLGYIGRSWTFEKKVAGGSFCRVRLDRALATIDWSTLYPGASVQHLTAATSDHGPILLELDDAVRSRNYVEQQFRYELMWETHTDLKQLVETTWGEGDACVNVHSVHDKLLLLSGKLSSWSKDTFGNVRKEIKKLKRELEE